MKIAIAAGNFMPDLFKCLDIGMDRPDSKAKLSVPKTS